MRKLKLVVLAIALSFASCSENEIIKTDIQSELIKRIGIENIISFGSPKSEVSNYASRGDYPAKPLCQSLSYEENEQDGWVVYEWNNKFYYGIVIDGTYGDVEVTESFAKGYCSRQYKPWF